MKKLLSFLLLTLGFIGSGVAGSQLDFTLSDFCYQQPNVQDRGGVYYFPNEEVGITDSSLCVYKDLYGQYMSKVELVNGRFDGKFIRWWENGQKHQEKNYKDGKLDGKSTDWWSDGSIFFEKNYKDGKLEGKFTMWLVNPAGFKFETHYKDGKEDGKVTEWDDNGQKISESIYKDGECISGDLCPGEQESASIVNEEQQKKNELEAERAAEQLAFEKEQYNRLLTQEIQAEQDLARQLIIEDQLNTLKSAYINNIVARVYSYWRYQGAEDDWGCDVYVLQDREGNVEAVDVQNCNFDDSEKARAFKNSIERAIYRASPFPIAPDDAVFDREILFYFQVTGKF